MQKNKIIFILTILGFLLISCAAKEKESLRKPSVAGTFYPKDKTELNNMIDGFLNNVTKEEIKGKILGVISPHAGYIYSGQVAAYVYNAIREKRFDTIILIGPSHHVYIKKATIYPKGQWQTPLGNIPIDTEIVKRILKIHPDFTFIPEAFSKEHSLEVEIPFLQKVVKNKFKIVPILINNDSLNFCDDLSSTILKSINNKNVLFVASSDMSHYYIYGKACLIDGVTIKDLEDYNIERLKHHLASGESELCGSAAVLTTIMACKKIGANRIKLLKYANSGDVTRDKSRVVGYGAFVILKTKHTEKHKVTEGKMGEYNSIQKEALLNIARKTIEEYTKNNKKFEPQTNDPKLKEKRAVFVTLHTLEGNLRGCIGYIMPIEPLYIAVRNMAIESAFNDPRFLPLQKEELNKIKIEISVLTVPTKVNDIKEIQIGKHGVIVKRGFRQGVFLPQVATETGWSKEEFLTHLCKDKAGLPPEAWKDKTTEIYIFSAEVFSE